MRKNDLIGGLIVVVVSAYLLNESRTFPDDAGRLPQLLAGGAMLLGAILIVGSLRPVAVAEHGPGYLQSINVPNLVISVALAIAYVALLDKVGYYIITPIYLLAGMLLLGVRNVFVLVGVTAGFAIIVYGVFSTFLHVPLPMGPLFG